MNKDDVVKKIEARQSEYTALSDQLWDHPEIGFDVVASSRILSGKLEEEGFEIESPVAGMDSAFIATWGSGAPVIGFLGEYDALPNLSQEPDLPEKKQRVPGGHGHGCGHHALGTASLAAAVALKGYLETNKMPGTIRFFGCPAEENGSGKAFMARAGIFDGLDSAITWHPMTENKVWGESSLANFQIAFNFKGISSHAAASPELGRSALDAAELMNVGVNYLREHVIQEARIHYAYLDVGGASPNVVQPSSSLLYFIRAPKSWQVNEIFQRIKKIAEGAALMTETEVEVEWKSACSEYILNAVLCKVMHKNMEKLGEIPYSDEETAYARRFTDTLREPNKAAYRARIASVFADCGKQEIEKIAAQPVLKKLYPLKIVETPLFGSTDVGDASYCTPTVQCLTASYPAGTAAHSWQWVATGKSPVLYKGMVYGAKVMAMTAVDLLENPELLQKAKEEFKERVPGGYTCYIPEDSKPA